MWSEMCWGPTPEEVSPFGGFVRRCDACSLQVHSVSHVTLGQQSPHPFPEPLPRGHGGCHVKDGPYSGRVPQGMRSLSPFLRENGFSLWRRLNLFPEGN